jgi:hypothetical protein
MHRHPHDSLARNPRLNKPTGRRCPERRSWDQRHGDPVLQEFLDGLAGRTTAVRHSCGCWIEWAPIIPDELAPEQALALHMAANRWAHGVKDYPCPWHGSASGAPSTARRDGSWVRLWSAPFPIRYREWPERASLPAGYPFDFVAITDERDGGAV